MRPLSQEVFRFGEYTLDCSRFELLRKGRSVRLERKPLELLILLASRNGELVSREEIREQLWGPEVYVDAEHGINTAVRKIRHALRDNPERPRFIQTVTGKGYRFAGLMEEAAAEGVQAAVPPEFQNGNQTGAAAGGGLSARPWLIGAASLLVLVLLLAGVHEARSHSAASAEPIHLLAVLPLKNLSGDPAQDYLADGMTDELTAMLAKDSTLRVVPRAAVMQYKGTQKPLQEIAQALGVDGIVDGTVKQSGGEIHVTLRLLAGLGDGSGGQQVWTESYDRRAEDAVSLPEDAAMAIAKTTGSAVAERRPEQAVNPEAHDAYLHGRYLWVAGRNEEAEQYFVRAAALQPDYALAWTGVADYYGEGLVTGAMNPREARQPFVAAARKAVALDGTSPQTHLTLCAAILLSQWDPVSADRECQRAIELDPEFAEAYHLRAKVMIAMGRDEEAIALQKKAMELDPFARPWALAYIDVLARQYDAAIPEAKQRLESSPHNATMLFILSMAYRCKGMYAEAVKADEEGLVARGDAADAAGVGRAFAHGGYRAVVRRDLAALEKQAQTHYVSPVAMALDYAQLGDREKTLSLLEEAYEQRSPMLLIDVQSDPAYDFLHADARYIALMKKTGLPPES